MQQKKHKHRMTRYSCEYKAGKEYALRLQPALQPFPTDAFYEAKGVTKQEYKRWEQSVIGAFYDPGLCSNNIVPKNSSPSGVVKRKWILVVDPLLGNGKCMSDQVADAEVAALPEVKQVQLWHAGKKELDSVKYGYDSDGVFKFPAWDVGGLTNFKDVGGLTNFKQFIGTPANFDPANSVQWDSSSETVRFTGDRLNALAPFSDKAKDERPGLGEWLTSVQNLNWGKVTLRLHALAPEHRVLVTPHDVKQKTGYYFVRVFTGNDDSYARKSTGQSLYCGVTSTYITPNLNVIKTEYEKC